MTSDSLYFDYCASTPVDPAVLETMLPYFSEKFGNPASIHHTWGKESAAAVKKARQAVANLLNADPEQVFFNSGATESINWAIRSVFDQFRSKGRHIITLATEHSAVLACCQYLETYHEARVSYLPVEPDGRVRPENITAALTDDTILIAFQYANNETGCIQPIREIGTIAAERSIVFFCDATQAVGKIPVDMELDGINLLALSAHKFYGPKGIGAIAMRKSNTGFRPSTWIFGGGQEKGLRSGTLNVPGIVGLGKAAELSASLMEEEASRLMQLRKLAEKQLRAIPELYFNHSVSHGLPHIINMSVGFTEGNVLLAKILEKIACSSGSACSSGNSAPSHVLTAMGIDRQLCFSSIRLSFGRFTQAEAMEAAILWIKESITETRSDSANWFLFQQDPESVRSLGWTHPKMKNLQHKNNNYD